MGTINTGKQDMHRHTVQMDARRHAVITGVTDVCSFHETEIVLRVDTGLMYITGEEMHIGKLLLDDGQLDIEGQLDSIVYEKPKVVGRLIRWKLNRK